MPWSRPNGTSAAGVDGFVRLAGAAPLQFTVRSRSIGEVPFLVKVGDRIRLSSGKGPDREGIVIAMTGSMVRVRWPSAGETTIIPAPGTLTVLASSGDQAPERAVRKKAVGKKAVAKETTAKKAAAGKATTSKKSAGKKGAGKKGAGRRSSR